MKVSNEVSLRLQKELDEVSDKLSKVEEKKLPSIKKKAPPLGSVGKIPSGDGVSIKFIWYVLLQLYQYKYFHFFIYRKFHVNH